MTKEGEKDLEKVFAAIGKLAQEIKLKRKITDLMYRKSAQDYQFILDENYHCEIREKLIEGFVADPKSADIRREIVFRLENAPAFEDIEKATQGPAGEPEDKIQIEDEL